MIRNLASGICGTIDFAPADPAGVYINLLST